MFADGSLTTQQGPPAPEQIAAAVRATLEGAAATAAGAPAAKPELFYTPASPALIEARQAIAALSFERAARRLQRERDVLAAPPEARAAEDAAAASLYAAIRRLAPVISQARPMMGGQQQRSGSTRPSSLPPKRLLPAGGRRAAADILRCERRRRAPGDGRLGQHRARLGRGGGGREMRPEGARGPHRRRGVAPGGARTGCQWEGVRRGGSGSE